MTHHLSENVVGIPKEVKLFTWLLILAGVFFAWVFLFNPGLAFPGAQITDYSSKLGFYSTGVRVISSVAGLVIAVLSNRPGWLALMLVTRLIIETGDILVGLATGGTMSNNLLIGFIALLSYLQFSGFSFHRSGVDFCRVRAKEKR